MKYYASLFTPKEAYVWMQVNRDDKFFLFNLSILHLASSEFTLEPSNFLEQVLAVNGWEDYFVDYYDNPELWMLQNGIAPLQPFLVKFHIPQGYKTWTDLGYEYDCSYEYEIVAIEKRKASWIRRMWKCVLENRIDAK